VKKLYICGSFRFQRESARGYIGRSVSVDMGYAHAKNKRIYAMCPIDDPPVEHLISGIMTPHALIDLLKPDLPDKTTISLFLEATENPFVPV
jgi:hypothetical protein